MRVLRCHAPGRCPVAWRKNTEKLDASKEPMDHAVQASDECVRDHLRRPLPGRPNLLINTAGNTNFRTVPPVDLEHAEREAAGAHIELSAAAYTPRWFEPPRSGRASHRTSAWRCFDRVGCLGEVGQDLEVGVGQAAPAAQLPLEELCEAFLHRHHAAPGPVFPFIQPPLLGHTRRYTGRLTCEPKRAIIEVHRLTRWRGHDLAAGSMVIRLPTKPARGRPKEGRHEDRDHRTRHDWRRAGKPLA